MSSIVSQNKNVEQGSRHSSLIQKNINEASSTMVMFIEEYCVSAVVLSALQKFIPCSLKLGCGCTMGMTIPLNRSGDRGSERLNNLPKVTQLRFLASEPSPLTMCYYLSVLDTEQGREKNRQGPDLPSIQAPGRQKNSGYTVTKAPIPGAGQEL